MGDQAKASLIHFYKRRSKTHLLSVYSSLLQNNKYAVRMLSKFCLSVVT